jgi:hypothetical protein
MTCLRVRTAAILVVLAAAASLYGADLPWVGQWKINVAKSDFGEWTVTFAAVGPGEMQWTEEGKTTRFKMDGKDHPVPWGGTAAWKQIDASTWETVFKVKDTVVSTDVTRLSADGNTLTTTSKGTRPNGKAFENEYVFARVSGGPGLPGKWKSDKVSYSAPRLVEMTAFETDGLALRVVDTGLTWSAKFGGKDSPVKGPNVPDGFTITLKRTGPKSFDYVRKRDGKEAYKGTYTVSADSKTMTRVDTAVGTNEKTTEVYDRQ